MQCEEEIAYPQIEESRVKKAGMLLRLIFFLYLVFVIACGFVTLLDPPWGVHSVGTWGGMFGVMASAAAALPWSLLLITANVSLSDEVGLVVFWGAAVMNLVLLAYLAFVRAGDRSRGKRADKV